MTIKQREMNLEYGITATLQAAVLDNIRKKNERTKAQRELDEFYADFDYSGAKS